VVPAFSVDCSMNNKKKCMLIFMCACVLLGGSYVYIFTSIAFVEVGLDVFLHAEMVSGLGKKMIVILYSHPGEYLLNILYLHLH
jgi:hypothetical protein